MLTVLQGDALTRLKELPDESVQCCVTSPPYWGLRDYNNEPQIFESGKQEGRNCEHDFATEKLTVKCGTGGNWQQAENGDGLRTGIPQTRFRGDTERGFCVKCNAWIGALGLEPTPELYVEHIVAIFRQVRRVLRKDGTLWLNLGDSYNNRAKVCETSNQPALNSFVDDNWAERAERGGCRMSINDGSMKEKDLVGIPWLVAFALRADGWWLRQDIIWAKPNPMPESVTDRCTKTHEYIFLLSKSARYFYDAAAIAEPLAYGSVERLSQPSLESQHGSDRVPEKLTAR